MSEFALQVSELTLGKVLRGISFDIKREEFVALLGPSGVGKTTILRLIAGLDQPDSGEISIAGRLVTSVERRLSLPPQERGIGMVFQSYALWPHLSVYENLAFPLRVLHWKEAVIRWRVNNIIKFLHLDGLERRFPGQISGGQQQRVSLGRALIYDARLVLLDEPLANVDPKNRDEIAVNIREVLKAAGVTALYVTHDQREALSISDRVILVQDGAIVQEGPPEDLFLRPRHPFAAEFFGASNKISGKFRKTREGGTLELSGASLPWSAESFVDGAAVVACLRHDDFDVVPAGQRPPDAPGWTGRVQDVRFYGEGERATIAIHNLSLKVNVERGRVRKGQEVFLTVKPARMKVFPA